MSKETDAGCGAVAAPVERPVRPVAEVRCGRLRWHMPTPDADPVRPFLDNNTHFLYDQTALDAAVAAERERWEEALRKTWRMVDPLKPAGTPGSYARGQDSGIVAALETLRQNLGPNAKLTGPSERKGHTDEHH